MYRDDHSVGLHQLVPHGVNGEVQVQGSLHDRAELGRPHILVLLAIPEQLQLIR